MNLLSQISDMENIEWAFESCLRGKKERRSVQLAFLNKTECLSQVRQNLLMGENYPWGQYREFYVTDPKRRLISSAPFIDRVAHRAIYNLLNPILDEKLIPHSFACRDGKGNGRAVQSLAQMLQVTGDYWAVKLDFAKYFATIPHGRLLGKLFRVLPDDSCAGLIKSLLKNHPSHAGGVGLPLGNLTSQIFANFYLNDLDWWLFEKLNGQYFRYMDDLILVAGDRGALRELVRDLMKRVCIEKLKIPERKRYFLGKNAGIPFLGFLVSPDGARPLNRNRRRHQQKLRGLEKSGHLPSRVARAKLSYQAWASYGAKPLVPQAFPFR